MDDHEISDAERKAIQAANRIFQRLFDGTVIEGSSKKQVRRNKYIYWETPDQWMFCYTPWKNSEGWYFAFTYKPIVRDSESGKVRKWKMVNKVRFRKRKLAKKRASKRYVKRMKTHHGAYQMSPN